VRWNVQNSSIWLCVRVLFFIHRFKVNSIISGSPRWNCVEFSDVPWGKTNTKGHYIPSVKAFLFTLSNNEDMPPTKYDIVKKYLTYFITLITYLCNISRNIIFRFIFLFPTTGFIKNSHRCYEIHSFLLLVCTIATAVSADVVGRILGYRLRPHFQLFWDGFKYTWTVPTSLMCVSVCLPAGISSAPTGWIFVKFYIWYFCENLLRKSMFGCNWTKISITLCEDPCAVCCSWWHKITTKTLFKTICRCSSAKRVYFYISMAIFSFLVTLLMFPISYIKAHTS
jgi:hypothetical protein